MRLLPLLAVGASVVFASRAFALEPREIAVVYNANSDASQKVAKHYAAARKIPDNNLIPVNAKIQETIPEDEYRTRLLPELKKQLVERHLDDEKSGAKCLVTTYDMPLKIGKWNPGFDIDVQLKADEARLQEIAAQCEKAIALYDAIGLPAGSPPATAPGTASSEPATQSKKNHPHWNNLVPKLAAAAANATQRLEKLPADQRNAAYAQFISLHERMTGIAGALQIIQIKPDGPNADKLLAERDNAQAELARIETRIKELANHKDDAKARLELVALQAQAHGLVGAARQLDEFVTSFTETESAFDNELTLLFADQNYPRGRWLLNPRGIEVYPQLPHLTHVPRVILVTRLDGSSAEKVIEMIDRSIEIEKKGLEGKLYLDARGIKTGAYAVLDIEMRQLAEWLKSNSTQEVVLDDKPELLKAEDCPDAALYCGWYSLENYKESCQWVPGAVGYHVASGELNHLHDQYLPKSKPTNPDWVVNLLDRGFCGTLGPTAEPYLSSFPNPAHFFPLLLSGEFTQGEIWEVTEPMTSWRTAFVGDPLYNPYKAHPKVKAEAIKEHPVLRNAYSILRPEK